MPQQQPGRLNARVADPVESPPAQSAGFDGVELHGGNGYLQQQFLANKTNLRTDEVAGACSRGREAGRPGLAKAALCERGATVASEAA